MFGRIMRGLFGAFLGIMVLGFVVGSGTAYFLWRHFSANLPSVEGLKDYQPPEMSRVFAGNGRLLADLATERRIYLPINAIPKRVQDAFISAEDQNFWVHGGVDPAAIIRAGITDLMRIGTDRRPIGASTITQQVVKNMLLNDKVTLSRKIREALLSIRLQHVMSKKRILELYLNEIYLGMGAYGVAAASEAYFDKPLDQLTLAEDAFLGALPKAPNNYNPWKDPAAAKARRDWVLDRMADDGDITSVQAAAAKAQPIVPAEFRRPPSIPGGEWFTEEVRRELIAKFGQNETNEGGLMVHTTLDPRLQVYAENAMRDGLMAYDRREGGWRGPVTHLAVGTASQDWPAALAKVSAPAGMLNNWRLAVVLSAGGSQAKVGWLSSAPQPNAPPQPRTGVLLLSNVTWARPVRNGDLGPRPRRITDVVQDGDVIMIQPDAAGPAQRNRPLQVTLRQIPKVEGALVSMDPATGRVLAMVGGWDYNMNQFNRATQAERQPGSSIKPFVYLTAMEKGLSPSQRFLNAPVVVDTAQGIWRPGNYENTFGGPTSLRIGLEDSLNLVTIRLAQYIGMKAIAKTAEAFGEVTSMPLVLPAAIGAVDTTVLQEASAYAGLDEGGRLVKPTLIDSVQTPDGTVVWRPAGLSCEGCSNPAKPPRIVDQRKQIADPASVYQVIRMMQGVVRHGTGVPAGQGINVPLAGKTGTTQNWVDAWFSGFSPGLVTVVWVGFDNPRTLGRGQQGAAVAAPIWNDFMRHALKGQPPVKFTQPPGVTLASWQSSRGMRTDAFKPGQTPGASLPLYEGVVASSAPTPGSPTVPGVPGIPGTPGTPGVPGTTPAAVQPGQGSGSVDASLGGLY